MADETQKLGELANKNAETNTDFLTISKLGTQAASMVNDYSRYLTNTAMLQMQRQQIDRLNSWTELQKEIEIKNIETRTGQLVGAQTAAYGFSGVTMSGSALDVTLKEMERGALDRIYTELDFAYNKIQTEYQQEMLRAQKAYEKRQAIASGISSVTSMASGLNFGSKGATGATDAQSRANSEDKISKDFDRGTVDTKTGSWTSPTGQVFKRKRSK